MMKKISLEKLREFWPVGFVLFILSITILAFAWWQVSPWTLKLFTKICDSNGGSGCMVFYWKQTNFYWLIFRIFSSLSLVLGLGTAFLMIKGKSKNEKSKKLKNRK